MPKHKHTISFYHAAEGIWYAVRTQPNFAIHLFISLIVISAGWWFGLSEAEWLAIGLTISVGLVIEMINTAIEATVDLITSEINPLAKIAKDCASGAMLIYAIGATVVGILIFLPRLWSYI